MLNAYQYIEVNKRLAAWLCCAVKKPVVDYYLCQHCANYIALESDALLLISCSGGSGPHGQVSANQLKKAFLSLMPDQRAVVYFKIGLGFSNQEVADILTKSIGAVKSIQQRALITLFHFLYSNYELAAT